MTRLCLFTVVFASLFAGTALAQEDDFLADAVAEVESEKKATQPLLLIPLQPVWKTIEPKLIDEAVKNIAAELHESGGFKVEQFNPNLASGDFEDPEPRLRKRWLKDIRVAENNTRKRRFSQAIKGAGRVVRQVLQNPEHLRDPRIYCRAMILVAEGELRRGRRNKTMSILDIVASNCSDLFDSDAGAELSEAFGEILADAVAEVRRRTAGKVVVQADEPGAAVFLNGVKVGKAPLIIRNVPPGRHLLAVVKAGHKPFGKVVKVGSQEVTIQARLTKPLGGGKVGRIFTEMRDNRISPQAIALTAELLRKHGGKATIALLGGIAQADAVIKVSVLAVDRSGQAVRLKSMSIDMDFLGLAPEMLGFTQRLESLSKTFVGGKEKGGALIAKLSQPKQDAQPVKWGSLALGQGRKSMAQQGNARGPLKRGRRPEPKEKRSKRKLFDANAEQANRRDEEDPEPRRAERRRGDGDARASRRAPGSDEASPKRPSRRARGGDDDEKRDAPRRRARRKGDQRADAAPAKRKTRRSGRRRVASEDSWGIGDRPRRLRKRTRSRMNWPLIAGASVVGVGVVGGGVALWYALMGSPSSVNATISWTVPE